MCANMSELQTVSERLYELEQKKAKKKKEMDTLDKEIKQLKSEVSAYMKRRRKSELVVAGLMILFTAYTRPYFDKDAFIAGEKNGETIYNKYTKDTSVERVTVKVAKER